jgi:Fe-S oxidoreductase
MSCKADLNARMLLTECESDILFKHAIRETRGRKLQHRGGASQMSCKADLNARMLLTECGSDILFRHAIRETRGRKLQHRGGASQQAHTFPEADRRALPRIKHKKKHLHS